MKRKVSLSFVFLGLYTILCIANLVTTFTAFPGALQSFSVGNLLTVAVPVALLILLHLNTKKDVKQIGQIILLVVGALNLYTAVRNLISLLQFVAAGGDLFDILTMLGSLVVNVVSGILLIIGSLSIKNGTVNKKMINMILLTSGFLYAIPMGASLIVGRVSVMTVLTAVIYVFGISCLPGTLIDHDNGATVDGPILKKIALYLVVIGIILFVALATYDGGNSSDSNTCGYCHREFDDSANKRSIARTGMCSNCSGNYKDMSGWLDDMED